MQSVVIDAHDRLWLLDTGRVLTPDGSTLVESAHGGPKLIGMDLSTNKPFQTILFPQDVVYPDSYPNDVRFDLRPNLTASGKGLAYITDSSGEGNNAIIVVDLGTGESWRRLGLSKSVRSEDQYLPFIWGQPFYYRHGGKEKPLGYFDLGADAIAISADGETLYWGPIGSRYLYSAPTRVLRENKSRGGGGLSEEVLARQAVTSLGQTGVKDGMETDSNGVVYMGNFEANAVVAFDPRNGTVQTLVRDPRINWVDTCEYLPTLPIQFLSIFSYTRYMCLGTRSDPARVLDLFYVEGDGTGTGTD